MQFTKEVKRNLIEVLDLLEAAEPGTLTTLDSESAKLLLTYIAILQHGATATKLLTQGIYDRVRHELALKQPKPKTKPTEDTQPKRTVYIKVDI